MSIRGFFTGRTRPWRLLKQAIAVLGRIATALEAQNALMAAANPEAAARLRGTEPLVESSVSYVNPEEQLHAERLRMQVQRETGRYLNDEQLIDYLQAQELVATTRGQELS
jgi:hypothetical protein